ncbi:MAG TPA: DUF4136 domain-containing protein [Parasegetibacter sp.]|jgi:hypothetical protein
MNKTVIFGFVALLAITGCKKSVTNNLSSEETRVYITNRDGNVNFSDYKTYSLVDSVADIRSNGQTKSLSSADAALLAAVRTEMNARGFVEVSKDDDPDLGLNVSKLDITITNYVPEYYPGYWSGYDAYYDPYYWGYGGYDYYFPTFYRVYQYEVSSITIDMVDLKNASANNQLKIIWNAQLEGDNILHPNAAATGVKAAFDQSAYLRAGN